MSSDLVVYVPPPTITSYSEAIEWKEAGHKLDIIFAPHLPESDKFAEADPDSPEGMLNMYILHYMPSISIYDSDMYETLVIFVFIYRETVENEIENSR